MGETKSFLISLLVVSLGVTIAWGGEIFLYLAFLGYGSWSMVWLFMRNFAVFSLATFLTIGPHEWAHRQSARKMGLWSHFKIWKRGLMVIIPLSLLGAPVAIGMTESENTDDVKQSVISVAGLVTNVAVGGAALLGTWVAPFSLFFPLLVIALFSIVTLGVNLIPVRGFDGYWAWRGDRQTWVLLASTCLVLVIGLLLSGGL